jgi:hypothetical protein
VYHRRSSTCVLKMKLGNAAVVSLGRKRKVNQQVRRKQIAISQYAALVRNIYFLASSLVFAKIEQIMN